WRNHRAPGVGGMPRNDTLHQTLDADMGLGHRAQFLGSAPGCLRRERDWLGELALNEVAIEAARYAEQAAHTSGGFGWQHARQFSRLIGELFGQRQNAGWK